MNNRVFTIPGSLTDLNTYINAERSNRFQAAKIKKAETARVAELVRGLTPVQKIRVMTCYWYTESDRKDADNTCYGIKFIMDGLVLAGVLPDDSRKYTGSIVHHFATDKDNPRVEVELV